MAAIGQGWVDGAWIEAGWVANPGAWADSSTVTATLSGNISDNATETELRAGAQQLIITLSNDTWVSAGAAFDAIRSDINAGITAAFVDLTSWNIAIENSIDDTAVVRTSDTVVTVTYSDANIGGAGLSAYDISLDETITVEIPASALTTSVAAITPTPSTFDITVDVVVEEVEQNTGGWPTAYQRFKSKRDIRQERIRMGIIPDDMPEPVAKAVEEAAQSPITEIKAKQLAETVKANEGEIERLVNELRDAYKAAEADIWAELIQEAQQERDALQIQITNERRQRNNNAAMVLLMLNL